MGLDISMINVFPTKDIVFGKEYKKEHLKSIDNLLYFTESDLEFMVEGKTFLKNAIAFNLLKEKIDYYPLAGYASLKLGIEMPIDPESAIHRTGASGKNSKFEIFSSLSKKNIPFEISNSELSLYQTYEVTKAYAVRTEKIAFASWESICFGHGDFTDDLKEIEKIVSPDKLPNVFYNNFNPEHSLFRLTWWLSE